MFYSLSEKLKQMERNLVFAVNSNFLIPISLQPDSVNLWFNLTKFKARNIKVLHHRVAEMQLKSVLWKKTHFISICS